MLAHDEGRSKKLTEKCAAEGLVLEWVGVFHARGWGGGGRERSGGKGLHAW